jgi:enolase-phosphatase E1
VTIDLTARGIRAVLLDIEGTTTPMAFVHEVLFPFACAHLGDFLEAHRDSREVQDVVGRLASEHAADRASAEAPPEWRTGSLHETMVSVREYARWLMDRDRKSPGLKLLQGLIWEMGYQAGELRGQVFDDVPGALMRWRTAGMVVAIYSSGSELAQRRLFESTPEGDLTPFIVAFFDTAVGAKIEGASYTRIAGRLHLPSGQILFVSDSTAELRAAREAGMRAVLSLRSGNRFQPDADRFEQVRSLDEIA